ncbi:hypothetical protein Tco_1139494 [Tanacetum coccineum]
MTEMFRLLKELTVNRTLEKVLIREEARHPVTKNVNSISLVRTREEKSTKDEAVFDDISGKFDKSKSVVSSKEVDKENEAENMTEYKLVNSAEEKLKKIHEEKSGETPNSQFVGYYLKHKINKKLFEGLIENQRYKKDKKRPFILGTPFLATAKGVIKFNIGTITLRARKSKMSFHRIPKSLYRIEKGIKNDIEPIAPTMTVNRLVLEREERIKLH